MSNVPPPPSAPDEGSSVPPVTPPPASAPPSSPTPPTPPSAAPAYAPQTPGSYSGGGYGAVPASSKTNVLAIVSLIASLSGLIIFPFLGPVAGIITGHIGLSQIKRTGEQGRGLAMAGTVIGYVLVGLSILVLIIIIAIGIAAAGSSSYSDY